MNLEYEELQQAITDCEERIEILCNERRYQYNNFVF
jgi:hypothetical protein